MEKISKHISYKEGTRSITALRKGINNTPNDYELANMETVAANIFEPLREWVGGPIKINSFFRCEELNTAIGGSSNSQHCQGRAIDIDDTYGHKTNAEMFGYIAYMHPVWICICSKFPYNLIKVKVSSYVFKHFSICFMTVCVIYINCSALTLLRI